MPDVPDFSFPKQLRLRRKLEFDRVFQQKLFAADVTLVVHAVANGLTFSRLGLSVSRKVGNAVVRNRWKRCIRESFRLQQHQLPKGMDIVVRPKKDANCDFDNIFHSLTGLLRRLEKRLNQNGRASGE